MRVRPDSPARRVRLAGIGGPGRHRLLDEHVASPAKGLRRVLEVRDVRRSDDDAVRLEPVHLEVVLGDVGQVEAGAHALELRRSEPADRDQLRPAVLPDVGDVVFAGPPPGPHHRDPRLLLHPCHRELPDTTAQSSASVLPPGTHGRRSQYYRVEPEEAIQEVVICDLGLQGAASINQGGAINRERSYVNFEASLLAVLGGYWLLTHLIPTRAESLRRSGYQIAFQSGTD